VFHKYLDTLYGDWLKKKSIDELVEVLQMTVFYLEKKKGCSVIGTLDIWRPKEKDEKED